jgi:hypothetical protein
MPPEHLVQSIAAREAALWVGPGFDTGLQQVALLCRLIGLPWRLVLCESNEAALAHALEASAQEGDQFSHARGFMHLVASNPDDLQLPPRALPVYLLNGRADAATKLESAALPASAALRRRLNMIDRLVQARPQVLVVLSGGQEQPLQGVFDLWEEEFRSRLVVASTAEPDVGRLQEWLRQTRGVDSIELIQAQLDRLVEQLTDRLSVELPAGRLMVRVLQADAGTREVDVTGCELVEQPLLDRFDLIQSRHLQRLLPHELPAEVLDAFFGRSAVDWRAYSAGLPWVPTPEAHNAVLAALAEGANEGAEANQALVIVANSGAGGTTLARSVAFEAAQKGYPTLVARAVPFSPSATEIGSFLYRMHRQIASGGAAAEGTPETEPTAETPWLLVFDVVHWRGREEHLHSFLAELERSGRPAVVLLVVNEVREKLIRAGGRVVTSLLHEITQEEALDLGRHLNLFLGPRQRAKSESEWLRFYAEHSPFAMAGVASFWIALEFWLKRQLDLGESIQSWLYRQFKDAELTDDVRRLLLEIAALSVERQPLPEGLFPPSQGRIPHALVLEDVRRELPALALVQETVQGQRRWGMAHDLLGRYLINSTFYDRAMLERLGLDGAEDPIHLRLRLLERIATRGDLARKRYLDLALEFAVNILKLDTGDGGMEFARYWREVLELLDNVPPALRQVSRTFNHHVAISRRRVATAEELFHTTPDEKRALLERAIEDLEFALNQIPRQGVDESDLNLLNSLSLAYQNLADLERSLGSDPARLKALHERATQTAREAERRNSSNSYVLETLARNLLLTGQMYRERAAETASEALGYIYQAMSLDSSVKRHHSLTRLANEALGLLVDSDADQQVERLCAAGNSLGFLARAWLVLAGGEALVEAASLADLPRERLAAALGVLEQAQQRSNSLILKLRYQLLVLVQPWDFDTQLRILDELQGSQARLPLQLMLERAILLHQRNRHHEGNQLFRDLRGYLDDENNEEFVRVPPRLQWLLTEETRRQRICDAKVVEVGGYRARARVKDLHDNVVPFIAQEFGRKSMAVGQSFKCSISFGPKGPFVKPPPAEGQRP